MDALQRLIAKDEIRELALLYARGVDRRDIGLLRTLYTADATDHHGAHFDGPADAYMEFLERALPHMHGSGHHVCNHLISVEGDEGEGEVYAIAWHLIPDGAGGLIHDIRAVRYIDRYRREDGAWRFAERTVSFDMKLVRPAADHGARPDPAADASYRSLASRLFARGGREAPHTLSAEEMA